MNLLVSTKHRVLHIVLNRPEKRNALSLDMCTGISTAVGHAQDEQDVGSVMISASGTVFCSGMDLDEVRYLNEEQLAAAHEILFSIGSQSVKPIIVAVNGAALGGGLGLVAQGHVVLAAEGATFGLPEIRVGLWPFMVYRSVEAALGGRRTLELSLTGQSFNADQACSWGLVHRVCPGEEIGDRSKALARELAKASPLALQAGMQFVRDSAGKSWTEAGKLAAASREQLMKSPDFVEGCVAFKERREARWPSMRPSFYSK
ncbi:MAG: enoyl-CoA hydratase/isomerase family protein [Acidobacteriota bacterium]|nr:enoyl-CoA hydratase/isomerase family protein [Acidobacteriota bacterium]